MPNTEPSGIPAQKRHRKQIPLTYLQSMFRPAPHFDRESLVRKVSPEAAEQILGDHFDSYRNEFAQMLETSPLEGRTDVVRDRESYLRGVTHLWESFKSLITPA